MPGQAGESGQDLGGAAAAKEAEEKDRHSGEDRKIRQPGRERTRRRSRSRDRKRHDSRSRGSSGSE
jgi:hypothetical protein